MIFLYIRLKDNYAPNKLKKSNFYQEKIVYFKFWKVQFYFLEDCLVELVFKV